MADQTTAVQTETILSPEKRRQQFKELGWWVTIPLSIVPARWLQDGQQRLDAEYYAADVVAASRAIRDSQYPVKTVKQIAESIFYPGRFRRTYAKNPEAGTPFLTASEMLHFRPSSEEYLANNSDAVEMCRVKPGSILVTRSGTVGRCVIVGNRLSKFAITDDALRVESKDLPVGYLYAFLSTSVSQTLISKDQYGSPCANIG